MAFGERLSPAASLRMALHEPRARSERTGFSPHAPAFCCVRLKSAKNLYLRHRFFNEIRQIHRFFCNFRQKLQILCRNQARESWGKSRRKLEQSRRIYEPEMHVKSEQKYSDKARKTGKSLRHGEKIRQITQTWCTFQAAAKAPQLDALFRLLQKHLSFMRCERMGFSLGK